MHPSDPRRQGPQPGRPPSYGGPNPSYGPGGPGWRPWPPQGPPQGTPAPGGPPAGPPPPMPPMPPGPGGYPGQGGPATGAQVPPGRPGPHWGRPPRNHPWNPEARDPIPSRRASGSRSARHSSPCPDPERPRRALPLWKRLHLPYVAALVVLFPVMVGWPYLTEAREVGESGLVRPEPRVVEGSTATMAGSEWEVLGYLVGYVEDQAPPPEGVELVDVGFKVTPEDDEAAGLLNAYCRFRALDEDGRSWEPTTEYGMRDLSEDQGVTMSGCSDAEAAPIPAGKEQTLVLSFLVPEEVAEELRYEVTVTTTGDPDRSRPKALLFEADPLE